MLGFRHKNHNYIYCIKLITPIVRKGYSQMYIGSCRTMLNFMSTRFLLFLFSLDCVVHGAVY
jgi:hypothetical protein